MKKWMSTLRSADAAKPGRVIIGRIVGAHGIRGALRVHPLTDYPERFLDMDRLYIELRGKADRELEILDISSHEGKGIFLVTVAGINDRDTAEALTGALITVMPHEKVELPDDEYWIDSLIGLAVVDTDGGETLGIVEDVLKTGASDLYQVRTPDGKLKLIPAVADIVKEIDIDSGLMRVVLPEGLWD